MRLFHVSEQSDIRLFEPRIPTRSELAGGDGLVWAISETCLPNYLTPRDCPRVTFHVGRETTLEDCERFLSSPTCQHVVAIEAKWFPVMRDTTLYLYEFDPSDFRLQDAAAGYYVSRTWEKPLCVHRIDDLFDALFKRQVELRVVDNLWPLNDMIRETTFDWSMCRMANAQPPC